MRHIFACLLFCLALPVVAGTLNGRVVHVEDGDTAKILLADRSQVTIRLADIDAPESCHAQHDKSCVKKPGQPFGENSKKALAKLVLGKAVVAQCREIDRYGRSVCRLYADNLDVNAELVKLGMAWVEPRYNRDRSLPAMESSARSRKVGLWAGQRPILPSEWRSSCWKQGVCPN